MTNQIHQPDYVIRKKRSPNWYLLVAIFSLILLGAAFALGYWLNSKRYDFSETAQQQYNQLEQSLVEANASAVHWQQQYEIELEVNKQLQQDVLAQQTKFANLQKEQEAYQRIFDPDATESGLQIASFVWEKSPDLRYSYRLLLMQAKTQLKDISGKYAISLVGTEAGESKEYDFSEVAGLTEQTSKFRFRYLEQRQGVFSLPEGFEPKHIRVVVTSSGRGGKTILQDFPWQKIES